MKVLLTGGSGFVGSHLADAFIGAGHQVTVFDERPRVHEFRSDYIAGDIRDPEAVDAAVRNADMIVHAAGVLGTHETVTDPHESVSVNVLGSLNVLQAVTRRGKDLICISKPNVWLNPYSITKDSMEKFCFMYASEFDTRVAVVKLYNLYGPRQKYHRVRKAIPTWIVDGLSGRPIEIYGSGAATVDLIHASDAAAGILAVADNFEACRIHPSREAGIDVWSNFPQYNRQVLELGSGTEISVNDTVRLLGQLLEVDIVVQHLPMRRGEVDGTSLKADISRLARLSGFEPGIALANGLLETIDYYSEQLARIEALELE